MALDDRSHPQHRQGKFAYYAGLLAANDALIWVLFTGAETDDNIRDADNLTALIATSLNEATFTSYPRVTATGVTVTVDDVNNRVDVEQSLSGEIVDLVLVGSLMDYDLSGSTCEDTVQII